MKGPRTTTRQGVTAFVRLGDSREAAARKESRVFDELRNGGDPIQLAVKYGVSVPTIYAIDKREARKRGVAPNKRTRSTPVQSTHDRGEGATKLARPQTNCSTEGGDAN